jgi:hypothetical protein
MSKLMRVMGNNFRRFCLPAILLAGLSGLALAGCEEKLETGYTPKRFDMTASREKAIFADPYSKEAQAADQDNDTSNIAHKPGQNY